MNQRIAIRLFALSTIFSVGFAPALALADDVPPAVVEEDLEKKAMEKTKDGEKKEKRKDGWAKKLSLGANGSATSSSNVVGTIDGTTYQIGVLLDGEFNMAKGQHDWNNSLKIQHAQTRTPAVDAWLKSADNFELQSTWLYRLAAIDWVGPFARARLQTQLWRGETLRASEVNVERTPVGGTATTEKFAGEEPVALTGAFEPVLINETVGVFANPFEGKALTVHAKLGAGGQHVFSRGGYALTAYDEASNTLKLAEIETTHQAGGEFEVEAKGELNANVKWTARTRLFFPFVTKSEQTLSGVDAMTTEAQAGLSVKLAKWASLDYVLNVRRIPLVLDAWQVQHGLLLTTGFNLL